MNENVNLQIEFSTDNFRDMIFYRITSRLVMHNTLRCFAKTFASFAVKTKAERKERKEKRQRAAKDFSNSRVALGSIAFLH
jgi:hypothetical protein